MDVHARLVQREEYFEAQKAIEMQIVDVHGLLSRQLEAVDQQLDDKIANAVASGQRPQEDLVAELKEEMVEALEVELGLVSSKYAKDLQRRDQRMHDLEQTVAHDLEQTVAQTNALASIIPTWAATYAWAPATAYSRNAGSVKEQALSVRRTLWMTR